MTTHPSTHPTFRAPPWVVVCLALVGCGGQRDQAMLDDAVRVSVALRGLHPSDTEQRALLEGRATLESLARGWVREPAFGATVRDLHAEQLWLRTDSQQHPPPIGPLAGVSRADLTTSLDEEPLRLVEAIVMSGRPYTEVLTAATTMADANVALAYGLPFDPAGPAWQEVAWGDGRPAAGLLSTSAYLQRYQSGEQNRHRSRASRLLGAFTCDPLDAGAGGILEPTTFQDAVRDDPACTSCHDVLDPVASAFAGARRFVAMGEVYVAEQAGCPSGLEDNCYPIALWDPSLSVDRVRWNLPEPAWKGVPVDDLGGLGRAVAADPAFDTCTARRFRSWFARELVDEVDEEAAARLGERFRASGYDARALAVSIVLDPAFLALPRRTVRPEQAARLVEDLTGYRWTLQTGDGYGSVALATSDEYGLRALMGGIDGWNSLVPDADPSPTAELSWRWLASEAAAHAVDTGREPRGGLVVDPRRVRDALEELHFRWLGELADRDTLDADLALFEGVRDRAGARDAWVVVLTALLTDDRVVGY